MKSRRNRLVVFTVLTGGKETLGNPFPPGSTGFERVCFTDDPNLRSDHWSVVHMESRGLDPERESRRPKLLPHRFLADFDWSLYIDGTVRLRVHPDTVLERYTTSASSMTCFAHPWRDCVYDEAEEVIRLGFDDERRVREQMDHYRRLRYPSHAGLIAGTVLLRRHNDDAVLELHETWYEHVLRFSRRDQLSFNLVAWLRRFAWDRFAGDITANDFVEWPVTQGVRLPGDFRDDVYEWLSPEVSASEMSAREHYMRDGVHRGLPYRTARSDLVRLANKYMTDKGTLYFNAHGYAFVYEHYLEPLRDAQVRLLELGLLRRDVQERSLGSVYCDAPSLYMWREYFPKAEIFGFDMEDFSQLPEISGVTIVNGDVGSSRDLDHLVAVAAGPFDVIVDDASHASHHQQFALANLFPHLRDGGFYFIEDLTYQPAEVEVPGAPKTLGVLKDLAAGAALMTPSMTPVQWDYLRAHTEFIEFHDSQDRQFGDLGTDAFAVIKKR